MKLQFTHSNWKALLLAGTLALAPTFAARAEEGDIADIADKTEKIEDETRAKAEAEANANSEEAPDSKVAEIALTSARRVTDPEAVTQLSAQLKAMGKQARLPLGPPEVLSWTGKDFKREQGRELSAAVVKTLKEKGYVYGLLGAPLPAEGSTTTVFTATNDEQKRMLVGYWVESDFMLLLVWSRIQDAAPAEKAEKAPAQKKPAD
jgi:hypothetical protein